jgi:ABC-type glycerol-3-phosphate transport system permease component
MTTIHKQSLAQTTMTASAPSRGRLLVARGLDNLVRYGVLILFAVICLIPLFWVLATSLKVTREIAANPLGFPTTWHWENYVTAWTQGRFSQYFMNSVYVSVPIVIGTVALSALAGYGLAQFRFAGAQFIFYLFLLGLMIPFQSIMIPLFYILKDIGFLGTYAAMIAPSIALGLSFGIFFMRAFFASLPAELADAAMIDGCNELNTFWRIQLPLAGPAVATLAVLNFMGAWNSFLLPLIYMQKDELRPLVLGLMFFQSRYTRDFPLTMAGAAITMLPIIIVYLFFQRQFVQGLTSGAFR